MNKRQMINRIAEAINASNLKYKGHNEYKTYYVWLHLRPFIDTTGFLDQSLYTHYYWPKDAYR